MAHLIPDPQPKVCAIYVYILHGTVFHMGTSHVVQIITCPLLISGIKLGNHMEDALPPNKFLSDRTVAHHMENYPAFYLLEK